MSYRTRKILLTGHLADEVKDLLNFLCHQSNNLYNCALFAVRQDYFSRCGLATYFDKDDLFRCSYKARRVKVSYSQLCKDFQDNPHYKALGGQQGQQCLKSVVESVKSYNQLLGLWFNKELPAQPRLPNYRKKGGLYQVAFPGQAIRYDFENNNCQLPISKEIKQDYEGDCFWIPGIGDGFDETQLVEVRIIPTHGKLWAEYVFKCDDLKASQLDYSQALGIDPGTTNWLTCVSTLGKSFIIDGHKVKSVNARYNKRVASYKQGKEQKYWDEQLNQWTHERSVFMRDAINKTARFIVNYCLNHGIGNIVFGWSKGVKDGINIGKRNNQNFVQIPTARLIRRIEELGRSIGINLTETEESYTSIASFLDDDVLPVFGGEKPTNWKPSGKRIKRGLYQTATGSLINADCNGAANILKKVTTQLKISLAEVDGGCLIVPKRYNIFNHLKKIYRKRCESAFLTTLTTSA